jgi:hypothetical protein
MRATVLSASIPSTATRPKEGELTFLDSGITYTSGDFTESFHHDQIHGIKIEPIFQPGKESFRNLYITNSDLNNIIFTVTSEDLKSVSLIISSLNNRSETSEQNEPVKFGLLFTRPMRKDSALIPIILIAIFGAISSFTGTYNGAVPGSSIGVLAFVIDIVFGPLLVGLILTSIFFLAPRRVYHLLSNRRKK